MESFFGRFKALKNTLFTVGKDIRILNIVNGDGTELGYQPQVDWNTTPQTCNSLAALLEWRTRLTPLIGRGAEVKQLLDWADEPYALSFKIVQAQGGVGKTRLAAEVAQALVDTKKWSAGFVSLIDFHGAQCLRWQGHWLVVVDYPEHAPERLLALLRAAKAGLGNGKNDKLRVILLCRTTEGIQDKLGDASVQGYLSQPLALKKLPPIHNFQLLTQALAKLRANVNIPPSTLPEVSEADFAAWQAQSALHHTALFVIALAIHLSTAPSAERRFLPGKELLMQLVTREQVRWQKAEDGLHLARGTLADVIAMATLFNGLAASEITNTLTAAYGWTNATRSSVFTALAEVWPARQAPTHVYPSMAPDLLATAFLWQWQSAAAKEGNAQDILAFTGLAKPHDVDIATLLQRWHMLAYDQTVRLDMDSSTSNAALSALLHRAFENHVYFAEQLRWSFTNINAKWPALLALAAESSRPKMGAKLSNETDALAANAQDLNNHAVHLANAGDRAGALIATRQSVDIRRCLVKVAPASFESDLASSINNLANCLSLVGDRDGALEAAREAVNIYKRLANAAPNNFQPNLATSITNLANFLNAAGDRTGALVTAHEAVDIYRRLARDAPASFEPALASSIHNLAIFLSATGDPDGALKAAREAVGIRKRLAKTAPANFESSLANSNNNLSKFLSETGNHAEALLAARETVDIYRRLAKVAPASFMSNLATSVSNLSSSLGETGDSAGAVQAAREAVDIFRRLAEEAPASFEPALADCINTLVSSLNGTGDRIEALLAGREAVDIYRRLAKAAPDSFDPNLAGSVNNQACILYNNGDLAGALMAGREAVDIYKRLARTAPESFESNYATSLNNLARYLNNTGDHATALLAAGEAVDIYSRLAKAAPASFEPDLAMGLGTLMVCLMGDEKTREAREAGLEALQLFEKLNLLHTGVFEGHVELTRKTLQSIALE